MVEGGCVCLIEREGDVEKVRGEWMVEDGERGGRERGLYEGREG